MLLVDSDSRVILFDENTSSGGLLLTMTDNNISSYQRTVRNQIISDLSILINENIVFEFTNDPLLIHQYHELRKQSYSQDRLMSGQMNGGKPDQFDFTSDVLIARQDKKVLGGCRLTISTPEKPSPMPSDDKQFNYCDAFPEYKLTENIHCEITRFVISNEYRKGILMEEFTRRVYLYCVENSVSYLFATSILIKLRRFANGNRMMGCNAEIRKDIKYIDPSSALPFFFGVVEIEKQPIYSFMKKVAEDDNLKQLFYRTPRTRPIGFSLLRTGTINKEQLKHIVRRQHELRENGYWKRFGELAVEEGFCVEEQITKVLEDQAAL